MTVIDHNGGCVCLSGVTWQDYVRLRDIPANRNVRMTYDDGDLELMSPSKLHERIAELLGQLVSAWTQERQIPVQSCGSTTFQRQDRQRGLEPDKCYYIQCEAIVRDREALDLAVDPPPDLVIEVDVSSLSRRRLAIYAQMGVPEVWLWCSETLRFFLLSEQSQYLATDDSAALPGFPRQLAEQLLMQRRQKDDTSLVRDFRKALG